ncbi:MAG: alpha/beta hydrolase, partial [Devosia sp.]
MKWLGRIAVFLVVVVVFGYAAASAYMYFNQRSFQYAPEGKFLDLGETLLKTAEVVEIPTSNNERIRGWYAPPQPGKPVIVYYKGNADSFSDEHVRYEQFVADGFGFLAFDYRGFPASPGVLNQENVLKDAVAAYAFAQNKGFPLVIWGRSLGAGPATFVAKERDARALLLETPFDSAAAVAKDRYWFLPVDWIMQDT